MSEQSFDQTVAKDTTDVYAMPSGALYWYGNECGISGYTVDVPHRDDNTTPFNGGGCYLTKNTNNLYIYTNASSYYNSVCLRAETKIDVSGYKNIYVKISNVVILEQVSLFV